MIPDLPGWIFVVSGVALAGTLWIFNRALAAAAERKVFALILTLQVLWLGFQGWLAVANVYQGHPEKTPPLLFRLGLLPALLSIGAMFLTKRGRRFIDRLPLQQLTLLSVVRVPVELALFGLYLHGLVPRLMTFEGGNPDILSGVSAAALAWFAFGKGEGHPRWLLMSWNLIGLGLLANIVGRALLSAPFPFQKLAFDQPNVAILEFPFVWLPTFIVPVVLFSHLVSIRQLMRSE